MNIAYLVLAHNQPNLLIRAVEKLNQDNASFFIHFDKKDKQHLPTLTKHFDGYKNVHIISTQNIYWMGFNMVQATIQLLQLACSSGTEFKYYVLMSGQDYPIKNAAYINDFFNKNCTDFISYNSVEYMSENFKNKVKHFHFMDNPYFNPRSAARIPLLVKLYYGGHKRLDKFLPKRSFYKDYTPYFGSQWFALTGATVKYILDFLDQHKDYVRFMKLTEGPDELFFQTIILNSERKHNLYDYERYEAWLKTKKDDEVFIPGYSSLRYMDWSEELKVKPAILDNSYYERLVMSKELFARKFDAKISAELLDKIDLDLLG
jgi:hypothetical protein